MPRGESLVWFPGRERDLAEVPEGDRKGVHGQGPILLGITEPNERS